MKKLLFPIVLFLLCPLSMVIPQKSGNDVLLDSMETFTVQEIQISADEKPLAKLPESVLDFNNDDSVNASVIMKIFIEERAYLKRVTVNVVKQEGGYKLVEGLNQGDILFLNPDKVILKLAEADTKETKERFCLPKRIEQIKNKRG